MKLMKNETKTRSFCDQIKTSFRRINMFNLSLKLGWIPGLLGKSNSGGLLPNHSKLFSNYYCVILRVVFRFGTGSRWADT